MTQRPNASASRRARCARPGRAEVPGTPAPYPRARRGGAGRGLMEIAKPLDLVSPRLYGRGRPSAGAGVPLDVLAGNRRRIRAPRDMPKRNLSGRRKPRDPKGKGGAASRRTVTEITERDDLGAANAPRPGAFLRPRAARRGRRNRRAWVLIGEDPR